MKNLQSIFLNYAEQVPEYNEACSIVLRNSKKRTWLIGGFIFRTLAMQLYGTPKPEADLDFIVEEPSQKLELPEGWDHRENHFGNSKLIGPRFSVDFVPLANIHSIIERQLPPTIENFLTGTPLTIQSLAFEIQTKVLYGDIGMKALLTKTVAINNADAALSYADRYNKPITAYIAEKTDSLNFKPILQD